ncbi:LacI family DNA-binding transcriptional regulator [Microbacterium sp.]|uniref:LacI family DNA-binding transcriptional regulator n=1 Tax=Microbacterium sp. TaxID=51671 RepID=UPI001AC9AE0A|nr:LacI family DNA-binding transcriptional regulator [Microbacterium sp.]MBN9193073.1 LacI family DNA-binding transcriptional regulator [Microbacterium sp.]
MSETTRRPTVKEVAERAGVSPMTVSRTLAGGVNVRPDLQDRVLAAVAELGYHRNENARSIRPGQSSGLIGVAITNIANPYYSTFALGVEEEADRTGRRILLGNTSEDAVREAQLVNDFLGRRVEGLIVVPTGASWTHLAHAVQSGVPVALASRRIPGLAVDSVVLDDEHGAHEGTAALLDAGHRRIAYLGNMRSIFTGERRYRGFSRAHEDRGLSVDAALVPAGQQEVGEAATAMRALLELADPPTAVFCANNRNAIGAVTEIGRQIAELGRSPADLPELVSFDDFELSGMMPVPVSVIDHDARALGRQAARLLLDRLDGRAGPVAPREVELPVVLRRRSR